MLLGVSPAGRLDIGVEGLRSRSGLVRLCMTTRADHFPACEADPAARRMSVAAGTTGPMRFDDLPSGDYAIALFHDENGNGRLDKRFGIPIEGFGFSRNPRVTFGAPRFAAAEFRVAGGTTSQMVKLRYLF